MTISKKVYDTMVSELKEHAFDEIAHVFSLHGPFEDEEKVRKVWYILNDYYHDLINIDTHIETR